MTSTGADVFVGLMSGTSVDGIAAAAVRFHEGADGRLRAELLGTSHSAYTDRQRDRLHAAMVCATPDEYCRLAFDLGDWFADAATALLHEQGIDRSAVRAIAPHGHTIWHVPNHSTWQLGEPAVIAERLGVDVVANFRVRDVAAGGQGAPLVSAADVLLFAGDRWRALQNLGGIGNVTVVPPHDTRRDDGESFGTEQPVARAFDTGPGVAVIDAVARRVRPELPYDVDGRLAAAGAPVASVVDELLAAPYFAAPPPKSTGRELFTAAYVDDLIARCRGDGT